MFLYKYHRTIWRMRQGGVKGGVLEKYAVHYRKHAVGVKHFIRYGRNYIISELM